MLILPKKKEGMRKLGYFIAIIFLLLAFLYSDYGPEIFKDSHSLIHFTKPNTQETEEYLQSPSGLWLYKHIWRPKDEKTAKSIVFIVHGFAEHIRREGYNKLAEHLAEEGNIVIAFDQRGHGRSTGHRGHVKSFNDYSEDLLFVINREYEQELQKLNRKEIGIFLYSHSMGTIVATETLLQLKHPSLSSAPFFANYSHLIPQIKGTIQSGTGMEIDQSVLTPTVERMINIFSNFLPKLPIDSLPSSKISRNELANERYGKDPLVFKEFLARWSKEFLSACFHMKDHVRFIDWPLLIVHGEDDSLAKLSGSQYIFDHSSTPLDQKTFVILEGALHEPLEDDHVVDQLYRLVDQFIDHHI